MLETGIRTRNLPTAAVSLWVPPAPGIRPRLVSGSAKYADFEAKMRSH